MADNDTANTDVYKNLCKCNRAIGEVENIYHQAAKAYGLSEGCFWILYCLRANSGDLTQSDISSTLFQPKQTIHSALKILEDGGYLELIPANIRRSKYIRLTMKGVELARRTVDHVIAAEITALSCMAASDREILMQLSNQYTSLLGTYVQDILKYQEDKNEHHNHQP